MRAVIDTNVLLVANGQHADVSPNCVTAERVKLFETFFSNSLGSNSGFFVAS
jgi:hypothetical protein